MHQRLREAGLSGVAPRNPDWSELSPRDHGRFCEEKWSHPSEASCVRTSAFRLVA